MRSMFLDASAFNHDLSKWDVSTVTDMGTMFSDTSIFLPAGAQMLRGRLVLLSKSPEQVGKIHKTLINKLSVSNMFIKYMRVCSDLVYIFYFICLERLTVRLANKTVYWMAGTPHCAQSINKIFKHAPCT